MHKTAQNVFIENAQSRVKMLEIPQNVKQIYNTILSCANIVILNTWNCLRVIIKRIYVKFKVHSYGFADTHSLRIAWFFMSHQLSKIHTMFVYISICFKLPIYLDSTFSYIYKTKNWKQNRLVLSVHHGVPYNADSGTSDIH